MKKTISFVLAVILMGILSACLPTGTDDPIIEDSISYTVTFDSNGGTSVLSQEVAAFDQVVKPTDPEKAGFNFLYWYINDDTIAYNFNLPVSANFTLHAKWEAVEVDVVKYSVTFDSNGGSSVSSKEVEENNKVTKPTDPTRAGYVFLYWYVDDENEAFDFNTLITSNLTLTAQWKEEIQDVYATDLFISMYAEGAPGFRKAIQIFNGTGEEVTLDGIYTLNIGTNGGTWRVDSITLSGVIPHLGVYVVTYGTDGNWYSNQTSTSLNFNGNDAVGLFKNDVLIDLFGVYEEDPGVGWSLSGGSGSDTVDHVVVRKETVIEPKTTWSLNEWEMELAIPNASTDAEVSSLLESFTWEPIGIDSVSPVITIQPDTNPITLIVDTEWTLPIVTAIDNIDGDITHLVEFDGIDIQSFIVDESTYLFTVVDTYEVHWSVFDEAGNETIYVLDIQVVEASEGLTQFDYSGFDGYYNTLSGLASDEAIIGEIARILRDTLVSYKGYNTSTEYNWVYNTTKGGQYILYDTSDFVFDGDWVTRGWRTNGLGKDVNGNGNYNHADGDLFVDREHIWPANNMQIMPVNKARSLTTFTEFVLNDDSFDDRPSGSERGHYSDLHNMWNADRNSNQALHSDHYFGNTGVTGNPNRSGQTFYPGDEYIGDIARSLFYMTLTYPHLTLVAENDLNAGVKGDIYYGYLNVLLEWNALDPVSPEEIARNEKIYENQGNRNPFIDFYNEGAFADIIFSYGDPEVAY